MNLYFEMLEEYNKKKKVLDEKIEEQKEVLKGLRDAARKNKERINDYVGKNLIFGEYDIASYFDQEKKVQIYYPVLHMNSATVGKITNISIKCNNSYVEEEPTKEIIQQYELRNQESNLSITITAISNAYILGYSSPSILLEIKNNIVMDNKVKYEVRINNKEQYSYERDFEGKIINKVLEEKLKYKYIYYSNFDKKSADLRRKRLRNEGRRGRICKNMSLTTKSNWNKKIYMFIYNNIVKCLNPKFDAEKVIVDITNNYKNCSKEGTISKSYQISGDEILVIELDERDENNNSCCAYEDESLILEIPYPNKKYRIDLRIYTYEQISDVESYREIYNDTFYIIEKANIDFDKKIYILDILNELKAKA